MMLNAPIDAIRRDLDAAKSIFEALGRGPSSESEALRDLALTEETEARALKAAGDQEAVCRIANCVRDRFMTLVEGNDNIDKARKDKETSRRFAAEICDHQVDNGGER